MPPAAGLDRQISQHDEHRLEDRWEKLVHQLRVLRENGTDFGTALEGRDEIMRYYAACLEVIPSGAVSTVALLTGIDMAVWVWQAGPAGTGADVMTFDDDGLIFRQQVTAPRPD